MKKAIVTGATGFIGSYFVQYLTEKNIEVLALGRKALKALPVKNQEKLKNAKYLELNMSNISDLEKLLPALDWTVGADCVFFNLAWGGENGLSDLKISAQMQNIVWCASAIEVAKHIGCCRFIQIGTMEEAFTEKYLELDHYKDKHYNRHVIYSVAKIAAKNTLKAKAAQLGIDLIYVLHSHVMGPNDDKNSFFASNFTKND